MPVQDFSVDWSPLANLGKILQEKQQKEALKQAYATPGLGYEEMARRVGAAGDAAGAMNLLRLGEEAKDRARQGAQFQQTFGLQQRQEERAGKQFGQTHGLAQAVETRRAGESERDFQQRVSEAKRAGDQFQQTFQATEEERARADTRAANTLEKQLEPESVRLARAAGLKPDTPEWKDFIIAQGKSSKLSATEMKAVNDAEAEVPKFKATIDNVSKALSLNDQIYTGWFASARGKLGDKTQDELMPDVIADPKKGAATVMWEQLMGTEAIKNMSETLKGASTDFEMRQFLERAADVSKSPGVRKEAMEGFLRLAREELALRQRRAEQIRAQTQYKPQGGATTAAPAPTGGASSVALRDAKAAIETGRISREEAIKRLQSAGIDPTGL